MSGETPPVRGLARDSLVYAVGLALQRGLVVLVVPAATRILEPAEFGVASAALAVGGFLTMVLALGFNYAVVRLYFDEPAEAERTEWAMLVRVQVGLAGVLAGMAWLLGPWWSRMYEDVPWGGALQAAVVLALAQSAQSTTLGILRAAGRVWAFSSVVLVQVSAGGALALVLADRSGPGGLVGGLAAGAAAGALLGMVLTHRPAAWSWPSLRGALTLSIPFVAHTLSSWVLSLSDRVLIERFLDLADLAAYHVAYALALVPILLTDAVQAAWLPRYYGLDARTKAELPGRVAAAATWVVVTAAAAVVLVAPAGLRLLAPERFDAPDAVVALVVSITFVRVAYLLAFAVLSDAKDSAAIARASGVGAVLNVGLNLWLIPVAGLEGAAIATLVSYAAMSLMISRRVERDVAAGFGLASLVPVWAGATGLMLALAELPDDPAGWLARAAALLVTGVVGIAAAGRMRSAYREALTA